MPRKLGMILIGLGVVLMTSALLLFLYNGYEDAKAGKESQTLLTEIRWLIEEESGTDRQMETSFEEVESEMESETELQTEMYTGVKELRSAEVNGYSYIGYLTIPNLNLDLPVMSWWDYERLRIAPCRQFGRTNEDMVIAAHNYKTHFKYLDQLQSGDEIFFTDMDGEKTAYTVSYVTTLDAHAVEEVQYSGYALVLYTCTLGGGARVAVFCERTTL